MVESARNIARQIFEAGVMAVRPENLLPATVRLEENLLHIAGKTYVLRPGQKVHVFGSGKAVVGMAEELSAILGERLADGCLVSNAAGSVPGFTVLQGSHPIPDERSVAGARELQRRMAALRPDDFFVYLLSGGSSALIEEPTAPLSLEEVQQVSRLLLHQNVPIQKINIVRKHLSAIKGGRLGQCTKAVGAVLVLSDVVGDDLSTIGSGPLYADVSTYRNALDILAQAGITGQVPTAVLKVIQEGAEGLRQDTPAEPADNIRHFCIGTNRRALAAAAEKARELGYSAHIMTSVLEGDAESAAAFLYALGSQISSCHAPFQPPTVLLFGGETTVQVTGHGRGGRNQQLALAALQRIGEDASLTLLSAGTDGIDGNSHAAGAIADAAGFLAADAKGLEVTHSLAKNDATSFFEAIDGLVVTGPTGTNVMDIMVLIVSPKGDQ